MPDINIKLLHPYSQAPQYKTADAAAMDCYAALPEPVIIQPGKAKLITLGFALEIPEGWEGELRSRSGFSFENSVILINGVGTIDADYRGEVKAALFNVGDTPVTIENGMRIAQIKFNPTHKPTIHLVTELSDTERGIKGFGSTGIHA